VIRRPASADFSGFTLVELAVVMFVVALLVGGLLMPLSAQNELRQREDTHKLIADARDALMGYAASTGRVPCPALTALAGESPAGGHCAQQSGFLPALTLGVPAVDPWGRSLRYAVATSYTATNTDTSVVTTYTDAPTTAKQIALLPSGSEKIAVASDLRTCSTGGDNRYVIFGIASTCAAPAVSINDATIVAIWSDGKDDTTTADDILIFPALPALAGIMIKAGAAP
jgi:type II secretory pathway pseudopilin PulG